MSEATETETTKFLRESGYPEEWADNPGTLLKKVVHRSLTNLARHTVICLSVVLTIAVVSKLVFGR